MHKPPSSAVNDPVLEKQGINGRVHDVFYCLFVVLVFILERARNRYGFKENYFRLAAKNFNMHRGIINNMNIIFFDLVVTNRI
jgi:hypothetical protein